MIHETKTIFLTEEQLAKLLKMSSDWVFDDARQADVDPFVLKVRFVREIGGKDDSK